MESHNTQALKPSNSTRAQSHDYSIPSTKIYCEDDYFAENCSNNYHLKCDQSLQKVPEPPLPFNYLRFNEYLRVKTQIECANRLVQASRGIMTPGLENYTEERLREELFQVYGVMDEKCEKFQLMFQNYKEQRLEQVQKWIENEKEVMRRYNEGGGDDDGGAGQPQRQEFLDEEYFLLTHFTLEEIASFKAVAAGTANPFMLPRKTLVQNEPEHKKCSVSRKSRGHLAQRNELVAEEVKLVLQQHSKGLTRDKLLQICNERLGRKAPPGVIMNLNSDMIDGYLSKQKILFAKKFFQEGGLIFPFRQLDHNITSAVPSCEDPMEILWEMRHRLLVILNLCMGIVEVDEAIKLHRQIFKNATLPYNDWGFDTGLDLIRWLFVQQWCSNGIELIQLSPGGKGNTSRKYYLAEVTDKRRKLLESNDKKTDNKVKSQDSCKNKSKPRKVQSISVSSCSNTRDDIPVSSLSSSSPWNKQLPSLAMKPQPYKPPILNYDPTATFIDPKYVQVGDIIVREENGIKPGTEFDCVVSSLVDSSPTNFYLVRMVKWRQLDRLFHELRDYWITHPTALSPHPHFLQPNYICMAKTDNEEEVEVYRVVILGKPDPHHYQVLCIDYGDVIKVRHDQLRYLPKDLLYILDAQSILCSLYNVASPTKDPVTGNDVWSKNVCDYAKKLLSPGSDDTPIVKVLFKQRMHGSRKWLVKVSTRNRMDLGEDVMKFVNKGKC